jgi:hypothetical protein
MPLRVAAGHLRCRPVVTDICVSTNGKVYEYTDVICLIAYLRLEMRPADTDSSGTHPAGVSGAVLSTLATAVRAVGARQCVQQVVHAREDAGAVSMSVGLLGGVAQSAGDVLAGELANVPG